MKRFLWNGSDEKKAKSKVDWDLVCRPKNQGGLGILDLVLWNKAAQLKHLWYLCLNSGDSLWPSWVRSELVKNKNFWSMKVPSIASWSWKKLLQLRPLARNLFKWEVGNGNTISLWYDEWHPKGALVDWLGERIAYSSGFPKEARLCSIINSEGWDWPMGEIWERIKLEVGSGLWPNILYEDRIVWKDNPSRHLSIKEAYNSIRGQVAKVPWSSFVWFKKLAPRHSFIMWLAAQQKLLTMDKLVQWGIISQNCCLLCSEVEESHNHLFINCTFVQEIWKCLKEEIPVSGISPLDAYTIEDLFNSVGPRLNPSWKVITSLVIYFVWKERNEKRIGTSSKTAIEVARVILNYFFVMHSTHAL